ncbi:energy-coupling factor transporter ATP-binding protein EcfA2 [Kibdelosporangium banguiense]|uniref:Energy-coupling factor transporter ATP-binding protein EcfA2 n=1 Tax=Kibdelosporangium banguiense TaxID=1365924 RepID=A0ABS4TAR9_9PSEU|nr:AAA family ATPase [Kibdelosporangium banguiense]MBP2321517.1 energy-coupling factor transporter ATP-binding protein EcfA2 [Kibdelosporangium banguiense]
MEAPPRLGGVRVLAIDGPSGSGKSTLAREVVAQHPGCVLVSTDDFATWDDPVSWWPRLENGVFTPLANGRPGRYQRMEWPGGVPRLGEWVTVEIPEILVIEGVSAGRRAVHDRLSCLVWVDFTCASARLERAVARDGERSRPHLRRWQQFESGWFAVDDPAARAGLKFHTG